MTSSTSAGALFVLFSLAMFALLDATIAWSAALVLSYSTSGSGPICSLSISIPGSSAGSSVIGPSSSLSRPSSSCSSSFSLSYFSFVWLINVNFFHILLFLFSRPTDSFYWLLYIAWVQTYVRVALSLALFLDIIICVFLGGYRRVTEKLLHVSLVSYHFSPHNHSCIRHICQIRIGSSSWNPFCVG